MGTGQDLLLLCGEGHGERAGLVAVRILLAQGAFVVGDVVHGLGDDLDAGVDRRVARAIDRDTLVDFKIEYSEQRGDWRVGGGGTPGLAPLRATILQLGLTRLF